MKKITAKNPIGIQGSFELVHDRFLDERGSFERLFCIDELKDVWGDRTIKQINRSVTLGVGTVRGLHAQKLHTDEYKIVQCIQGRVWDVIFDFREDSPTFMKWQGIELSPEKQNAVLIPAGCAHGFQCLEEKSELIYFHSAFYSPEDELGFNVLDPQIGIKFPMFVQNLSKRDQAFPYTQKK